jgi:hypothetical protein
MEKALVAGITGQEWSLPDGTHIENLNKWRKKQKYM